MYTYAEAKYRNVTCEHVADRAISFPEGSPTRLNSVKACAMACWQSVWELNNVANPNYAIHKCNTFGFIPEGHGCVELKTTNTEGENRFFGGECFELVRPEDCALCFSVILRCYIEEIELSSRGCR